MNFLLAIATILLAGAVQAQLPTILGLRLELLPAIVVYSALTFRHSRAIALAIIAGFVQDSLSGAPFGLTAIAYGGVAGLITSLRDVLDRDLPWVHMGAGAVASATASLAALCVVGFSFGGIGKLLLLAIIAGVVTPIIALITDNYLP